MYISVDLSLKILRDDSACPGACQVIQWYTVKPLIKDTLKEDKPPNKGQIKSYTHYRKSPLKEDKLSTKDKTAGPEGVLIKRFH